ncbi:thiosulfate oxidation carrier complex protein SoxZ [uncultured Enterovirga sp.]|uniref:thiosulfate oxidation carrier complex protein SoxZ n=1 Tax=uncultured Enterovirga sp. TaxID=2026352 RepID=UPI0035CC0F97
MARALINVPKTAKRGEVIEIRTLISHPMETGYRPGPNGRLLPRNIVTSFTCRFNETEVFRTELHPALSANPYLVFSMRAEASGVLTMTWTGDEGFSQTETATIEVT